MARPSKYEKMNISARLISIEGWARQGATNEEIAGMLGVAVSTLYSWKKNFPEFSDAISTGAHEANGDILYSAYFQSVGYYKTQREIVKLRKIAYTEENGAREMVRDARNNPVLEDVAEVVEYKKYFEADPRMTMFMLVNRLPGEYRQKIEATWKNEGETGVVEIPYTEEKEPETVIEDEQP